MINVTVLQTAHRHLVVAAMVVAALVVVVRLMLKTGRKDERRR